MWCFIVELFDVDEIDIVLSEEGIVVDLCILCVVWEVEVFVGINEVILNVL